MRREPGRASGPTQHIPTGEVWLCPASVLDLRCRRPLRQSIADHMRTKLVADALTMATGARGGATARGILDGDRADDGALVADLGVVQSPDRRAPITVHQTASLIGSRPSPELGGIGLGPLTDPCGCRRPVDLGSRGVTGWSDASTTLRRQDRGPRESGGR